MTYSADHLVADSLCNGPYGQRVHLHFVHSLGYIFRKQMWFSLLFIFHGLQLTDTAGSYTVVDTLRDTVLLALTFLYICFYQASLFPDMVSLS